MYRNDRLLFLFDGALCSCFGVVVWVFRLLGPESEKRDEGKSVGPDRMLAATVQHGRARLRDE